MAMTPGTTIGRAYSLKLATVKLGYSLSNRLTHSWPSSIRPRWPQRATFSRIAMKFPVLRRASGLPTPWPLHIGPLACEPRREPERTDRREDLAGSAAWRAKARRSPVLDGSERNAASRAPPRQARNWD